MAKAAPIHKYCPNFFLPQKTLDEKITALDEPGKEIFQKFQDLSATQKQSASLTAEEAVELSAENDIGIFRERFKKIMEKVQENPNQSAKKIIEKEVKELLTEMQFTEAEILERIAHWKNGGEDRWYRLLGDRTLEEVRKLYMGNDVGAIAADSLIGKYLSETGAKIKIIRYPIKPGSTTLGEPKILISVSQDSLESFKKIIDQPYSMSVLGHANVLHRGNIFTFGGEKSAFRLPSVNTPLPFLMMKTSESERFSRYMELAIERAPNESWNGTVKVPWKLPGYCATGGYTCCTHWLGNVPIGDLRVDTYKFPGKFENNQPPQIKVLTQYESNDEKIKQVWKVPGHQQLSSVIGQEQANLVGQFSSPGWVIQTLLGKTDNQRVPVIFWITADHTAEIPDDFRFQFEAPR